MNQEGEKLMTDFDPWGKLDAKMRQEPDKFYLPLLSPEILTKQRCALRVEESTVPYGRSDRIIAYAALRKTASPYWQELAQVWVDPEHRRRGLMRKLVDELIAGVPDGIHLFSITSDGCVMELLKLLRFVPMTKVNHMHIEYMMRDVFGLGEDRVVKTALREESPNPRDGERWLYVLGYDGHSQDPKG